MSTALNISFLALLTVVTVWTIVFGMSGYFFARAMGVSTAFGVGISVVFGPLGWAAIAILGKRKGFQPSSRMQGAVPSISIGDTVSAKSNPDDEWVL